MKRNADKSSDNNKLRAPFSDWEDDQGIEVFPTDGQRSRDVESRPYYADDPSDDGSYYQAHSSTNKRLARETEFVPVQRVNSYPPTRKRRRYRASRVFFTVSIVVAALLLSVSFAWNYLTGKFMKEPNQTKNNITVTITDERGSQQVVTPTPIPETSAFADGIKNILLIGSDSRDDGEHDLADVIMIMTIDNNNKQLKLSSIQRDMLVYVGGDKSQLKKINSVLQYGPELLVHTINENLSLDLQGYVEIDMTGTETIIDMMAGIEIEVPDDRAFIDYLNLAIYEQNILAEGWTRNENYVDDIESGGKQVLNGRQTLAYMRVRKVDSDYRRTERQREVLELLLKKFLRQNPIKMAQVVREGLSFVRTDLVYKDIFSIATQVVPALGGGMDQMQIPVHKTFWEDQNGNIVPSFKLMNPIIHQFVYGDLSHQLAVHQIPQAPVLETNYYIEPQTPRFYDVYGAQIGEEEAKAESWSEYLRQSAAGYSHREPPEVWAPTEASENTD